MVSGGLRDENVTFVRVRLRESLILGPTQIAEHAQRTSLAAISVGAWEELGST